MSIIDFIKTKDQKEKESKDYLNKIFPHGDVQKKAVKNVIEVLFTQHKDFDLFYTYIVIKELHLDEGADEEVINSKTEKELKKVRPKLNDEQVIVIMILLSIDIQSPQLLTGDQYIELINRSLDSIAKQ